MTKERIKIYAVHRIDNESKIIQNDIITPIRCGAVFDKLNKKNILGDDTGDNISEKRCSFCELTAQYWVWKNVDLDYYGFCHYRRYFSWSDENFYENILKVIWEPYLNNDKIQYYHIDDTEKIISEINGADIITVSPMDYNATEYKTVRSYYENNTDWYEKKDLSILENVIKDLYPEYLPYFQSNMEGNLTYYYNSYIMKKEVFHEYCEWLFSILFEFEKRIDLNNYSSEKMRSPGIMGERLFGVFLAFVKDKRNYIIKRKQLVFFNNTNDTDDFLPEYKNNNIPVFISSSDFFAPYASVTVQSIIQNSNTKYNYDIILLHSNMSIRNQELFCNMVQNIPNISIRFFDVTSKIANIPLEGNQYITKETFFRLIIAHSFKNFDKAIFLDADTVVLKDVANLFNIEIGNACLGATIDVHTEALVNGYVGEIPNFKEYAINDLRMEDPYKYYQMGVLIMNLKAIRDTYTLDEIINYSLSKKFLFLDQDILNSLLQGKIHQIDQAWDVFPDWGIYKRLYTPHKYYEDYLKAIKNPYIIHYAGPGKPWDFPYNNLAEYFWKYAKESLFFGIIMDNKIQSEINKKISSISTNLNNANFQKINSIINKVLPIGSIRRKIIKKIFIKK